MFSMPECDLLCKMALRFARYTSRVIYDIRSFSNDMLGNVAT